MIKSRTMYMSLMPAGSRPPDQLLQSLKHPGAAVPESELQLAQWIMVRERSLGRLRQKQSVPDDLDVSSGPMSPSSSRRLMLFFQVIIIITFIGYVTTYINVQTYAVMASICPQCRIIEGPFANVPSARKKFFMGQRGRNAASSSSSSSLRTD